MTLSLALRTALVLATALAASALSSRAPASTRRDLLTLGAAASLALPLFAMLPSLPVPAAVTSATHLASAPVTAAGPWVTLQEPVSAVAAAGDVGWAAAVTLWAVGACLFLGRLLLGTWRANQLLRGTEEVDGAWVAAVGEVGPALAVRAHRSVTSPMLVGWLRPVIVVPAGVGWAHARRVRVLRHELAHASSRDNLRLWIGHGTCAAHWFNPLAWMVSGWLRLEMERAADEAVVAAGADPVDYAADLVDLARVLSRRPRRFAAVTSLGGPPIERRVRALLADAAPRSWPGTRWVGAGGLVMSALVLGTLGVPASATPTPGAQLLVTAEVQRLVSEWQPEAVAVVVVDARTGEIVATGEHGEGAADRPWASGSVVKPFVAVAALDAAADISAERLAHLLEVSSNDGFVSLAGELGSEPLARSLRAQGLSEARTAPAAELALGQFPTTTRELAIAYAHLGDTQTGREVRALLTEAVHGDEATGRRAAVPGQRVSGKTGTTQLGADPDQMLASFVGMVPASDPRWVIAVQVAGPQPEGWGGLVAAPAFARLAAQL